MYDDLDKGLEYVQSMCEHAAHQFLRDGDCRDEVGNITRRMLETKELADRELERVQREAPAKTEEDSRVRSYRPPSMRKDFKDLGSPGSRSDANKEAPTPDKVPSLKASSEIEVDEGVEDMDDFMPKLAWYVQYKTKQTPFSLSRGHGQSSRSSPCSRGGTKPASQQGPSANVSF